MKMNKQLFLQGTPFQLPGRKYSTYAYKQDDKGEGYIVEGYKTMNYYCNVTKVGTRSIQVYTSFWGKIVKRTIHFDQMILDFEEN
jgi:hypothetical protein